MKKARFYRLAALALCFGLLAGCGTAEDQPSGSVSPSDSPSSSQPESQAPETGEPESAEPAATGAEVLRAIPYLGDADKCAMTAEQALAYAQLMADGIAGAAALPESLTDIIQTGTALWDIPFSVFGYSGEYQTDRANAILGDFAGDGQPYLCVLSSGHPECGFDLYYAGDGGAHYVYGGETYGGRIYTTFGLDSDGKLTIDTGGSLGAASHFGERLALQRGEAKTVHSWYEEFNYDSQMMQVTEDGVESYYTLEEWEEKSADSDWGELPDAPYTPIPLRDMIDYLNQYAAALGSDRAVTAEGRSEESQMALAMLSALEAEASAVEYDWVSGDARLVDLDRDGTPELVTFDGSQARLHRWQDGQLQTQEIGWVVGGWVEWWLCRDTDTGELGIEYRCNGGGDFTGGGSTFYYGAREENISDRCGIEEGSQTRYTLNDQEVTQAEYDAVRARNQRVEELISESGSEERVEQARAALNGML